MKGINNKHVYHLTRQKPLYGNKSTNLLNSYPIINTATVTNNGRYVSKIRGSIHFLPPPQNQPLTRPPRPAALSSCCCFFSFLAPAASAPSSSLASRLGNLTWLNARSKKIGLHGIGLKSGGKRVRNTLLLGPKTSCGFRRW